LREDPQRQHRTAYTHYHIEHDLTRSYQLLHGCLSAPTRKGFEAAHTHGKLSRQSPKEGIEYKSLSVYRARCLLIVSLTEGNEEFNAVTYCLDSETPGPKHY
jgi:hypothetical protein